MGWWKCSNSLYQTDIMLELSKSQGRYAAGKTIRPFIFIRVLDYSAESALFSSYTHLSDLTGQQAGQCKIVWDTCLKLNVLRKSGWGYSAMEWMQERGMLQKPAQVPEQASHEEKPAPVPAPVPTSKPLKDQVRPNVRLTRQEIDELKKDYSDEQISRMLDYLSNYKTNSGKYYASDYQAIRRWVFKILDKPKEQIKRDEVFEFPDWIFGIKDGENDKG